MTPRSSTRKITLSLSPIEGSERVAVDKTWIPAGMRASWEVQGMTIEVTLRITENISEPTVTSVLIETSTQTPKTGGITTLVLRRVRVEALAKQAVDTAVALALSGQAMEWSTAPRPDEAETTKADPLTDQALRSFVKAYKRASGTVEERGRSLGYSRASVYRLFKEARKRGLTTERP